MIFNGKVRTFAGRSLSDCPFRYQGQYEDSETGLYYNRFRYYSPDEGMYLSQDPIGLAGNNPTIYAYVKNPNSWVDELGLAGNNILFGSGFWKTVSNSTTKTNSTMKGASIFEITKKVSIDGINKGDYFHLDTLHLNEIEVYNSRGIHKGVYDLQGNKTGKSVKGRKICI